MQKALRIARKIVFWTFFVCLFLFTSLTVFIYVYEDDIKQYAIDELNSYLNTDIEVQNIELSVWRDFPYASLQFEKVFIADAYTEIESEDTLLYAENIFLNFSLLDIWNGDYKVKRLRGSDASLNMRTLEDGDCNYDIIRDDKDSSSENFRFMLELLALENIRFNYSNKATGQNYQFDVLNGLLQGDFNSDQYALSAEGDLFIRDIRSNAFSLIKNKSAGLALELSIDKSNGLYTFESCELKVEKMPFDISGNIDSNSVDIAIKGQNVLLEDLANSLADQRLDNARSYDGKGIIDFESHITGEFSRTEMPAVSADFNLANGSLTDPKSKMAIENIQLKGHYHNETPAGSEQLKFENLSFRLLKSHFSGYARVEDFDQPLLKTKLTGNLDLAAFHKFFRWANIREISGEVNFDLSGALRFFDPVYRKDRFDILSSDGSLSFKNVTYQGIQNARRFHGINGDVLIRGLDGAAKNLAVRTDSSDFLINGAISNLVPYIEGSGGLGLIASVECDSLNLDELLPEKEAGTGQNSPVMFQLPQDLNLNLDMSIKHFKWKTHRFRATSGKLLCANRSATLKNFKLNALGGSASGNLILANNLADGNIVEGNVHCANIDAKSLFTEWKNFDQKSVTDKHINGKISGDLDFILCFNPYFSLIEEKIYSIADFTITNGSLTQLETMKDITAYMRSNALLKIRLNKHIDKFEEKLLNLKFSDLSNTIEVKDRKITIPKMLIHNNALDLELFGWHDFDNNVEYHFSFRFRDLKTIPEESEFGKIEDDGLGLVIYITMTGSLDNPVFQLDPEERKNSFKEKLADEKSSIKSILKTEFGMFKRDSIVMKMEDKNQREVDFILYEDDIEAKDSIPGKNRDRSNKFFEGLKNREKKEEEEFDIEIED